MKKLSTKIITILALCIALNIVGSNIALLLKLPIYLDTIGTKGLAVFLVQVGTDYLDRLVAIYVVSLVYKALKSRISLGVTKY